MRRIRHGHTRPGHSARPFPRQRVGNPLFPHRAADGRSAFFSPKTLVIGSVIIVVAAVGWYLVWSPFFRIKNTTVAGASPALEQALRPVLERTLAQKTWLVLPGDNILFFNKKAAMADIGRMAVLDQLELTLTLPDKLEVRLKERPLKAVMLTNGRFLALDGSGLVLRDLVPREIEALGDLPPDIGTAPVSNLTAAEAPVEDGKQPVAVGTAAAKTPADATNDGINKFPLIVARTESGMGPVSTIADLQAGDTAYPAAVISLVLQADARLPDLAGGRARWFVIRDSNETVEATMDGDWRVFLTTLIPFDAQAERLASVLKQKIGEKIKDLEYVDLRYNERVFFRYKGAGEGM